MLLLTVTYLKSAIEFPNKVVRAFYIDITQCMWLSQSYLIVNIIYCNTGE